MRNKIMRHSILVLTSLAIMFLPAPSHAAPSLTLGIHPYLAAAELYKRFTPLAEYLEKMLGTEVTIRISSTYEANMLCVRSGEIDIAFMGPAAYAHLPGNSGQTPLLAAFESDGKRTFRGSSSFAEKAESTACRSSKEKILPSDRPPRPWATLCREPCC